MRELERERERAMQSDTFFEEQTILYKQHILKKNTSKNLLKIEDNITSENLETNAIFFTLSINKNYERILFSLKFCYCFWSESKQFEFIF